MNHPNLISYIDEDGQRYPFGSPGTEIFRDGTYYCPSLREHRLLSPKHRKLLARYIHTAKRRTYEPERFR